MFQKLSQKELWEWFSAEWFQLQLLQAFSWDKRIYLYFIPAVPLIFFFRWLLFLPFRQKLDIALSKQKLTWHPISLLRFIPDSFLCLSLIFILVALARPQKTNEQVIQYAEGIDIVLVLDISESMQIEDFSPNRLEAAKEVAKNFIKGRFQDRIGVVIFAGDAYSLCPLTTDYHLLNNYVDEIDARLIQKSGTAIGNALAVATNRMRESTSKSKVLILLSDGANTAGNFDPQKAAQLAHSYGVKIYSILIGQEGKVPFGADAFGKIHYVDNTIDESTLSIIAQIGEGKFFRASDKTVLEDVFKTINNFEKTEVQETRFKNTKDFYQIYLTWAIACLLIWLMFKSTFLTNILED